MSVVYLLDSGPLGMICYPKGHADGITCSTWFEDMVQRGATFAIPEIVDYEVRRAFIRTTNATAITKLDLVGASLGLVPIIRPTMLLAAQFWADMRRRGFQAAPDDALDADMILAAQASILATQTGDTVIIATGNERHLAPLVPAENWRKIA